MQQTSQSQPRNKINDDNSFNEMERLNDTKTVPALISSKSIRTYLIFRNLKTQSRLLPDKNLELLCKKF